MPFDLEFIDSLPRDPKWATRYSIRDLVRLTGTQGVELLMWPAARAALGERVEKIHSNYHIPISNTASGAARARSRGLKRRQGVWPEFPVQVGLFYGSSHNIHWRG